MRRAELLVGLVAALFVIPVLVLASGCGNKVAYFSRHVDVQGIAFPDARHAWLTGNAYSSDGFTVVGGAILATTDGGGSWRRQMSSDSWTPCSIVFANDRCGWMLGSSMSIGPETNRVLATTDGGATWQKKDTGTSGDADSLYDIACVGALHVWAVGGGDPHSGLILATTDGGATWRRETAKESLIAVAFADTRHGWVVGDGGILGTTDGGHTWSRQPSAAPYDPRLVVSVNARDAWALGADSKTGHDVVLATADGGVTWKVRYATRAGVWNSMAFADALHGWLVGNGGLVLATSDGGHTWHRQAPGTRLVLGDVAFADASHGVVAGFQTKGDDPMSDQFIGTILLRTSDGGVTWTR